MRYNRSRKKAILTGAAAVKEVDILKALIPIASTDLLRDNLCRVMVDTNTMTATDGHHAIVVTSETPWQSVQPGGYTKRDIQILALGGLLRSVASDFKYPDMKQIIPVLPKHDESVAHSLGINPMYVASASIAIRNVLKACSSFKTAMVMHMPLDEISPLRIDAGNGNGITIVAVIMPMRL